jgi:alkylresorcinol/alkylpyrone synthase
MSAAPRIAAVATAVPAHRLEQREVAERARLLFAAGIASIDKLMPVFEHAGIGTRYSCVPLGWFERDHGWAERGRLYIEHALDLIERAGAECLARARCDWRDIDGLVTVSTTGLATPSLDALLMERVGLRRDLARLPIFGLGCAGGVIGLSRAASLARADRRRVLLLVVELCALTFRPRDLDKANLVAAALFGDGAAGVLLTPDGAGPAIGPAGEHTWPRSLDIMGWAIEDDGFGVRFSRDIPALVRRDLRPAVDRFLAAHDLRLAEIDAMICHPGGAKVLAALDDALELRQGALAEARDVLAAYGNMSAATVLFVLERMLARPARRSLMSALGPGFTAAFQLLEATA